MSNDVSEVRAASETSVDIQLRTRQYIPEDSELHTRRRENFKSHRVLRLFIAKIKLLQILQMEKLLVMVCCKECIAGLGTNLNAFFTLLCEDLRIQMQTEMLL
jgi:hypothetical protein